MDFCIISPTAGLKRYATLSKTHLVLAQITDPAYQEFYIRRREAGDTIILDNGAYELSASLPEDKFLGAIELYNPQWIVCPDILFQPWQITYSATERFLRRNYTALHERGHKLMGVPQTTKGDLFGWIEGMLNMMEDLPLDGIGLPRALCTHYTEDLQTRIRTCRFIKLRYDKTYVDGIYVHAFGMAAGDPEELAGLAAVGCNSIDSSAPVWRGWNGLTITDPEDRKVWDLQGTPCDFGRERHFYYSNKPYDSSSDLNPLAKCDEKILSNLEACGVNTSRVR